MTGNEERRYRADTAKLARYNWATKVCARCRKSRSAGSYRNGGDVCRKCREW